MYRKMVFAIAAIAASLGMIVGMATVPYSQTAAADKDCSVGKAIADKPSNWGQLVSENAHAEGGNGETFSGFNAFCHAD
jgi:hypothetical protein